MHVWCPYKLSSFQDPPPPLSIYVQNSSTPLTLNPGGPISNKSHTTTHPIPSPPLHLLEIINNQLKENIIQEWLLYVIMFFLQVYFRLHYRLINLEFCLFFMNLVSFDFFHLVAASLSAFVWFYTLVCTVVHKYHAMCFI